MAKSCFFIGHREVSEEYRFQLVDVITRHIEEQGVTEFIVGGYGGFDRVVADALREVKVNHPEIQLLSLIPYHPTERPIDPPKGFDAIFYPEGMEKVPRRLAIVRANRCMVDTCDYLIAAVWHPGNSRNLLDYAETKERKGEIKITLIEKIHS